MRENTNRLVVHRGNRLLGYAGLGMAAGGHYSPGQNQEPTITHIFDILLEALDARIYSVAALAILNPAMDKVVGDLDATMESRRRRTYRPYTVSRILGISVRTVYRLIQSADLVGHSRSASKRGMRVNADSVKQYMKRTKIIPARKWIE